MAKRNYTRIQIEFTYSNGQTGGLLDNTVNSRSKKAIDFVLQASQDWLNTKSHTATKTTITEIVR